MSSVNDESYTSDINNLKILIVSVFYEDITLEKRVWVTITLFSDRQQKTESEGKNTTYIFARFSEVWGRSQSLRYPSLLLPSGILCGKSCS